MVERNIWPTCEKNLDRKEIVLLIGARQVGKTTLLLRIEDYLKKKNEQVYYFSLENPSLLQDLNSNPENIFSYIPKQDKKIFLLLDEVQYLATPSNFLKYHYDTYGNRIKLIVSGSSAFYIERKFTDSLAGRKRIIELFPFSFSEFLRAKERDNLADIVRSGTWCRTRKKQEILVPQRQQLRQFLNEYIMYGGYPGVVIEPEAEEKRLILRDLHQSFLKKDVLEAGVSEQYKFYQLLKIIASGTGALLNASEIGNTIGLSPDTVREYIHILRKSFIIGVIQPFHSNVRKELTKMPKAYLFDSGLRNTVLGDYRIPEERLDKGAMLENLVYTGLRTYGIDPIHFWRTQDKKEVDFVLPRQPDPMALEAKWQASSYNPKKYERFTQAYPDIPLAPICYEDTKHLDLLDVMH